MSNSPLVSASKTYLPGVVPSRTFAPLLPANYLSRKNLLNRITLTPSGVTLISAPPGYGKTSLATELALSRPDTTFWLTIDESDVQRNFYPHLIQSIRNVIPNFAPWFDIDEPLKSSDLISKITSEIQTLKENYLLIVDNNRATNEFDNALGFRIINSMPSNLHILGLRRQSPSDIFSPLTRLSHFQFFGSPDLKFSENEVEAVAELHAIDKEDYEALEILKSIGGWPGAIQLVAHNISLGLRSADIVDQISTSENPLKYLFTEVLKVTSKKDLTILNRLCLVEEFDLDLAMYLLDDNFSEIQIKEIAREGLFFLQTNKSERTYKFNSLAREALIAHHESNSLEDREIHRKLSQYFEIRGDYNFAVNHAKRSGDRERFQTLFRDHLRDLVWTGRGTDLIQWSNYLDTSTRDGVLARHISQVLGNLVNFEYLSAQSKIDEALLLAKTPEESEYLKNRLEFFTLCIFFIYGQFDSFDQIFNRIFTSQESSKTLRNLDKISLLRLGAEKAFIAQDEKMLESILLKAAQIHQQENTRETLYHFEAIKSLTHYSRGEYLDAEEAALKVIDMAHRYEWIGIYGPLDAMYVQALCQLEFSQKEQSYESFKKLRNLALKWKQGPWFFLSDGYIARSLIERGQVEESLAVIRAQRERIATLRGINELSIFTDINELYIRYALNDLERLKILTDRLPDIELVKRVELSVRQKTGKSSESEVASLPSNTPAEKIYKYIALAENSIDKESIAMSYMKSALEVGSRVGAKETFLIQDSSISHLILKIANEKPTVYLEDLASSVVDRLKNNSTQSPGNLIKLTKREKEVLSHLSTGASVSAIGSNLHVSHNTMKTHLKNIYRKLEAENRDGAVKKAKNLYLI